ncbi:MAG TPA: proline dehydrogenase family protein [Allosphingosinicella sp.]|jgi:proline dehydrogenase
MRLWQRSMIACARSGRMKAWAQGARAGTALAERFVAGPDVACGVRRAAALIGEGIRSSLFYLGEYLDDPHVVERNVREKIGIAQALGRAGLDVHVSVDPTQIGYSIHPDLARSNAERIAEAVAKAAGGKLGVHMLMIDMEDESLVDATVSLHDELAASGLPVGLTLQAYLRRTQSDLARQIARGASVRLVRGAFAAGDRHAFTSEAEIKANYRSLMEMMLSRKAVDSGFYASIATHDTALQDHARALAGIGDGPAYEFEMLLGVRGDVARSLARAGERVRLYLPFGEDWWPHALRRIGESPRNGLLLARSLLAGKR